ncbi:MAG: hypothetical protein QOE72_4783 [Chloroflexota bacterium]|jgi:hypothetical protein|nr:hypothetical protein [Chloroflexota bacterium]
MMPTRKRLAIVLGVAGVLAIGGSAIGAGAAAAAGLAVRPDLLAFDGLSGGPDACSNHNAEQQGATAGTETKVCQGSGLVFIAPSVGQVATVIGPTVIGPAQVSAAVAAGNVGAGV